MSIHQFRKAILVLSVPLLEVISAGNARAQDKVINGGDTNMNGDVADIIVTAQKRSENAQRVPIAITAVSPKALDSAGVVSTQGLAAALPGLQLLNIGNMITPRVRGVGSSFVSGGLEAPVATYVDDVYYAFGADINMDMADISQVTLLKGPQGTLFGRNATGGVLQITTRRPSHDFSASVQTSLDNYLTSRSNIFATGGVSDTVAASLSLSFTHQGRGYGTNLVTGNDTNRIDHAFTGRAKITADIDDTTLLLIGDYSDRAGPTAANFRNFPGRSSAFFTDQGNSAWDSGRAVDSETDYSGGGISLRVDHEFGFATLASISAYRQSRSYFNFTNVLSAQKLTALPIEDKSRQFTQEIQLVSPSGGRLNWAIGGFYFYNDARQRFDINFYGPLAATLRQIQNPADQKTYSLAAFAQATYKIADATRLTLGIRYTYDKREFDGQIINNFTNGTSLVTTNIAGDKVKFEKPTWRIALDHDFAPGILGYVSYNRGVKSGGFSVRAPNNPPFYPERLDAYEAGLKTQFADNKVRLNLGGFYYDYQNIQVPIYTGTSTFILNGASAEIYGLDADFAASLSRSLRLNASANWVHARFKRFLQAPFAVPKANNAGAITVLGDASGKTLPYTPSFTYTVGLTYDIPTSSGDFAFNVSDSYNSGFYPEVDNILRQPSYHLLNASVDWQSPDESVEVRLFVNNLLNEAVVSQAVSAPLAYLADYSNPPLTTGVAIKIKM